MTAGLAGQLREIELGFNPHELRDAHGKWTRTPGPFNPAVRHLYQQLPQVNEATRLGRYDEPKARHTQAQVHIVTLPGGGKVIDKRGENPEDLDREELASYIAQAIGAPAPAVYRAAPDRALQEFVPGKVAIRYLTDIDSAATREAVRAGEDRWAAMEIGVEAEEDARDAIHATPEARAIADLDYLISNDDRHEGNWMVTPDGKPVGIDHGVAMFDGMPSDSEFVENDDPMMRGHPGADPDAVEQVDPGVPAAVAFRQQRAAHGWELADQMHQVMPQFERTGHMDWFANIIQTPVAQLIDPADPGRAEKQIIAHWHDKYGDSL